MDKSEVLGIVLLMVSVFLGAYLLPQAPETMVFHLPFLQLTFSKLFLIPFIVVLSLISFIFYWTFKYNKVFSTEFRTVKKELSKFTNYFIILTIYFQVISFLWSMRPGFRAVHLLAPLASLSLYGLSVALENSLRKNYSVVPLPWNYFNNEVRKMVNRSGKKVFRGYSYIILLTAFINRFNVFFYLLVPGAFVIYLVHYGKRLNERTSIGDISPENYWER